MEGAGGIVGRQGRTSPLAASAQGNQPHLPQEPQLQEETHNKHARKIWVEIPFRISALEPFQAQLVLKASVIRQQQHDGKVQLFPFPWLNHKAELWLFPGSVPSAPLCQRDRAQVFSLALALLKRSQKVVFPTQAGLMTYTTPERLMASNVRTRKFNVISAG